MDCRVAWKKLFVVRAVRNCIGQMATSCKGGMLYVDGCESKLEFCEGYCQMSPAIT